MPFHQTVFTKILPAGYGGPTSCQVCHLNLAQDLVQTGHWNWADTSVNIVEQPAGINGARDLIDSFLIGVPANEGRCAQCHPSYGRTDKSFDFTSTASVDCFICHDSTGTYAKASTGGGTAALMSDGELTVVGPDQLQNVAYNVAPRLYRVQRGRSTQRRRKARRLHSRKPCRFLGACRVSGRLTRGRIRGELALVASHGSHVRRAGCRETPRTATSYHPRLAGTDASRVRRRWQVGSRSPAPTLTCFLAYTRVSATAGCRLRDVSPVVPPVMWSAVTQAPAPTGPRTSQEGVLVTGRP